MIHSKDTYDYLKTLILFFLDWYFPRLWCNREKKAVKCLYNTTIHTVFMNSFFMDSWNIDNWHILPSTSGNFCKDKHFYYNCTKNFNKQKIMHNWYIRYLVNRLQKAADYSSTTSFSGIYSINNCFLLTCFCVQLQLSKSYTLCELSRSTGKFFWLYPSFIILSSLHWFQLYLHLFRL